MEVQRGCPRCKMKEETSFHAIWECKKVKTHWRNSPFYPLPGPPSIRNSADLLWWCKYKLSAIQFEEFVVMCWWIWNNRNKVLFTNGGLGEKHEDGWSWVTDYLAHFRSFQGRQRSFVIEGPRDDSGWVPPSFPNYKLNTDAAIDRESKTSSIGAITRNEKGEVMLMMMKLVPFIQDVDTMEALAIREGMITTMEAWISSIEVETDSSRVADLLRSDTIDISEVGVLVDEIRELSRGFKHCSFLWCRRTANVVAHGAAKMALEQKLNGVWMEEVPAKLCKIVKAEMVKEPTGLLGGGCF